MEKVQTRLVFIDILIDKTDTNIWMDIYDKLTDCTTILIHNMF